MESQEIEYAGRLLFQYEYIRREGQCNMVDHIGVMNQASEYAMPELMLLAADRADYAAFLQSYRRPSEEQYQAWLEDPNMTGAWLAECDGDYDDAEELAADAQAQQEAEKLAAEMEVDLSAGFEAPDHGPAMDYEELAQANAVYMDDLTLMSVYEDCPSCGGLGVGMNMKICGMCYGVGTR